ncbi:glycosyltransferase, partial [Enterococcus faecium]|nr:glycosyltransferase [Enterococcus faecium]
MCEISIIMTVFNVEKYLAKAIDSVLLQTFADFELILVDDGSSDRSGEICDEYQQRDKRIKVIHQPNSGVSSARNTGLENAQGKFIGFVDSDDYIESDMYEFLYNNLIEEKADLSICGIYDVYEGKEPQAKTPGHYVLTKDET